MDRIRNRILKLEQVEWRSIKDLQPGDLKHVANADHIRASILKNGFAFPFAVWQDPEGDLYTIDGHTRKDVLEGMENVPNTLPAFFIDADNREDAIRILLEVYNQRHNEINPVALTEWLEVEQIAVETVNVESLHSSEVKEARSEVTEDEYDDTLPEHPETVLGDLYEIGPHRLLCGDSTDSDQVARLMNGEKGGILIADPPYGIKLRYVGVMANNTDGSIYGDDSEFDPIVLNIWGVAIQYVFGADYFIEKLPSRKGLCVWAKAHTEQENTVFGASFEIFWRSHRDNREIWYEKRINALPENLHKVPTQKPVNLIARCIKDSGVDGIIIDPFAGSGTTIVAADQLGLRCNAIEIMTTCCDVIVKRMIKLNPALTIKRNGEDVTDFWKEKAAQA